MFELVHLARTDVGYEAQGSVNQFFGQGLESPGGPEENEVTKVTVMKSWMSR